MQTIRRPADPHPQPILYSQHEMRCIGYGIPLNSKLSYVVEFIDERFITTFKSYFRATSEKDARAQFVAEKPGFEIASVTLI